jgi:hypothetical protein
VLCRRGRVDRARAGHEARAAAPKLTYAFELHATVAAPTELGQVPNGRRRIIDITGGTVEGQIKGKVRPGGADWQIVRADGFTELDTRYTLETDKGQLIYVQNPGVRSAPPDVMKKLLAGEVVDPALVYFRTQPSSRHRAPSCNGSRGRSSSAWGSDIPTKWSSGSTAWNSASGKWQAGARRRAV